MTTFYYVRPSVDRPSVPCTSETVNRSSSVHFLRPRLRFGRAKTSSSEATSESHYNYYYGAVDFKTKTNFNY